MRIYHILIFFITNVIFKIYLSDFLPKFGL